MAGDEEVRARAVLAEMQLRISQGPTSALGIGEVVTVEEVRAAFLGLTKQFHPARFGRLSSDLQRLSNEVFLGIKAAHDHMLKVLGSSTTASRGGSHRAAPSTGIPVMGEGTNRTPTPPPRGTQSIPRPATPPMGVPISRTATPIDGRPPTGQVPRPDTPVHGTRPTGSIPAQRPGTPPSTGRVTTPVPPGTQPGVAPSTYPNQVPPTAVARPPQVGGTQPMARAVTPVPPGTVPGVAPSSTGGTTPPPNAGSQRMVRVRTSTGAMINVPAGQARSSGGTTPPPTRTGTLKPGETSPLARPPTLKPGQASPLAPAPQPQKPITLKPGETSPLARPSSGVPLRPNTPSDFNPPTVRNVAPPAGPAAAAHVFDEASAFREAAALMEQKNWTAARQALHALAAKVPQSKTYRAWLCYARGREAYVNGRPDEAILEMQRALQLEPDLAHAKHALAELQRRR